MFGGVPSALKLAFYLLIPIVIIYGAVMFSLRVKNWQRGGPDRRATTRRNVKRRFEDFRAGVYMQTLLRDPAAGIMHSLIYFSFLILLAVTTILEINHQLPEDWKFLHGKTYKAYSFVGDAAGLALLVGVVWAIVRRYVFRPYRIRIKSKPEHVLGLGRAPRPGRHRLRCRGLAHRRGGPARVREVVVRRLSDRHAHRRVGQPRRRPPGLVGRSTWCRSSSSS